MPPHEYLFWQRGISKVIRSNEFKLVMNEYSGTEILYNLKQNKYENPDVASSNPKVVNELKMAFQGWMRNSEWTFLSVYGLIPKHMLQRSGDGGKGWSMRHQAVQRQWY